MEGGTGGEKNPVMNRICFQLLSWPCGDQTRRTCDLDLLQIYLLSLQRRPFRDHSRDPCNYDVFVCIKTMYVYFWWIRWKLNSSSCDWFVIKLDVVHKGNKGRSAKVFKTGTCFCVKGEMRTGEWGYSYKNSFNCSILCGILRKPVDSSENVRLYIHTLIHLWKKQHYHQNLNPSLIVIPSLTELWSHLWCGK